MKFPIRSDSYTRPENYRLDFQLWDKDLLTPNDYLSSITIDAWEAVRGCIIDGRKYSLKDPDNKSELKLDISPVCRRGANKGVVSTITVSIECIAASE